jgi:flagellar biosynthetic protein FliP
MTQATQQPAPRAGSTPATPTAAPTQTQAQAPAQQKTAATIAKPATAQAAPVAGAALALTKLAPSMDLRVGADSARGGLRLSGTVGIVVMMGLLTLLPTLLLMMTSFTRILIVLHFLRQALGTQNAPPTQLVAAIALLLSGFVMSPTLTAVNRNALQPWMAGKIEQGEMLERGAEPFRTFMLRQTRDHDLQVFVDLAKGPRPATAAEVPLVTLMSAFVTSELRTAFQIGFALFLPFIIIDVVVSSVLMSMGMFMLPPAMISLPFKLLLFVLVDGWTLIVQSLVASFK